jgi:hypothetical protein
LSAWQFLGVRNGCRHFRDRSEFLVVDECLRHRGIRALLLEARADHAILAALAQFLPE